MIFLGDKDVSKFLIDLKVDGLIFDHVAEFREEHSATENLFIGKEIFDFSMRMFGFLTIFLF
jgi:hypothetical protein